MRGRERDRAREREGERKRERESEERDVYPTSRIIHRLRDIEQIKM